MKTTIKRGIGRSAGAANGNGHAVLPPAIVSPVRRYVQPPKRHSRWALAGRFALGVLALVLLLALGGTGGAYLYYHESVVQVSAHSKDVKLAQKRLDLPKPNQPAIALVVGYDHRHGDVDRGRSDTLMLLRADPRQDVDSISMLSIPRDLVVPLWCGQHQYLPDRINNAYTLCGAKGTLDTMKHLTGLPINYLVTVNFNGFIQIVDRVGGVWVDVDRRYYNKNVGTESTNFSDINLRPGYQLLKGRDALSYVRYRHTDSDLFRLARQQQFVKALKEQVSSNFSVFKALKVVGAITHNVEIGQAGSGSLEDTIRRYALFAYGLPSGHFFQTKIDDLQGINELSAPESSIQAAVRDFQTPDVEAPRNATAVAFGRKAAGVKAVPPSHISISVLNGNGVTGSATSAANELAQRGYQIVYPANAADRNAPNFKYFHTIVYFDKRQATSSVAARKVADLFGDADVQRLPASLRQKAQHALVTVVVGSTFHGTLAPAPVDKTPKKQPPHIRSDPGQTLSMLKRVRRKVDFPLMVPHTLEDSSYADREVPIRVYSPKKGERAVRLTFLDSMELSGYWGIEETSWDGAPALQQPNFKHRIKGREFDFYYDGPHLHMVVLKTPKASYWVVNTLTDTLSNETMIEIAKGLRPLPRR
ncbi:MAG: LCP family protein [Gaiellaceae bacterium]|jgi:LCP family protein required for cell wall assembly